MFQKDFANQLNIISEPMPSLTLGQRWFLKSLLFCSGPLVQTEGLDREFISKDPIIFAFNHNCSYKSDPHSPLHFHTKVLGFERIGSHIHGELNCSSTRIILTLDILKTYEKLKIRKNKIYLEMTEGIRELLDEQVAKRFGASATKSSVTSL